MARKIPSLGRFLGAPSLYAMAYGEISSSLYYALGITAFYALSLTPVVFLAAGLLFALAAAAYAEGGATIPEPGGSSALARRAWGDLAGFIAGWATVLDFVITISLSALFLPHYVAGAVGSHGRVLCAPGGGAGRRDPGRHHDRAARPAHRDLHRRGRGGRPRPRSSR